MERNGVKVSCKIKKTSTKSKNTMNAKNTRAFTAASYLLHGRSCPHDDQCFIRKFEKGKPGNVLQTYNFISEINNK